jgi:hypothetical protein
MSEPAFEQSLFLRALELPTPADRAAFLDEACRDNPQLRAELDALLAAHDRLGGGPPPTIGPAPVGPGPGAGGAAVGSVLSGRYKLVELLGEGGMGTVWMAQQTEPVRRLVAVKVVKAGMDSKQVLARFEAERQALALMDHPHIARVLDAGTTPAGQPYFVMELVKGVPITRYCDEHRLTPRQRLELFVPVCQAIQHAHQKGVIHRDIKPSNVLVALYDGRPVPKVIDFGVAKAAGQPLTERTLVTGFGAVVGTLEYMSPEQAQLNQLDIDTRSDVYALGVLLYELLTGTTPLDRKRLQAAALLEVLRLIREEEPPRPSTRLSTADELPSVAANRGLEPKKLSGLVKGELDWIVMKALEKDRNRRYETANGFALDIQRYLADEPVVAGPPSARYALRKFVKRNRGPVIAAGLVLLALLGGVAGTTWGLIRAEQRRLEAEQARAAEEKRADGERLAKLNAEQQQKRAEAGEKLASERLVQVEAEKKKAEEEKRIAQAVRDFLQTKLLGQADTTAQANALLQRGGLAASAMKDITVRQLLDRAAGELTPEKMEQNFPRQPLLQAELLQTVGNTYRGVGELAQALAFLQRAAALSRQQLPADHPDHLRMLQDLAEAYRVAGQLPEAVRLLEQVRKGCEKTLGPEHPSTLAVLSSLAVAYRHAGRLPEAIRLSVQIRDGFAKQRGADHPDTLGAINNLAVAYAADRNLPEAIRLFEQVKEARERTLGPDHPDTLMTCNNLAVVYLETSRESSRLPEAIRLFERVKQAQETKLGADHPDTLMTAGNLAAALEQAGKLPEAIRLLEQSRQAKERKLGTDHPETLRTLGNLANAYLDAGNLPEAIRLSERVKQAQERTLGPDHPDTLVSISGLAVALEQAGKLPEAVRLWEQLKEAREKKLGADHPDTLGARTSLAWAYIKAGQTSAATKLLGDMLARARQRFPAGSPPLAGQLAAVGGMLLELKHYAESEPLLRESLAIREKLLAKGQARLWQVANGQSMLGGSLLGQKKLAEAEPLLRAGYEGLWKDRMALPPRGRRDNVARAVQRLVDLYEATGNKDEAAKWRQKLGAAKAPAGP